MDNEKLLKIINYYGLEAQLKYIHTEYFELDEAVINGNIKHIFGIDEEMINIVTKYKIDRQLERIDEEKDND